VCATRERNAIHFRAALAAGAVFRRVQEGVCAQLASAMQSIFVLRNRAR
jgi:hypothetical protein